MSSRPRRVVLSLIALALGATAAHANEAPPRDGFRAARAAATGELGPTLRGELEGMARLVTLPSPKLRRLLPPVTGKIRVAVLLVELSDCPRPRFGPDAWQKMLFSRREYQTTPTGQRAYGSVRDYYAEQSAGKLEITGRVFDWVSIPAKRSAIESSGWFAFGARKQVLEGALDALLAREGKDALESFDSLAFVVSGGWAKTYGTVLWPHSSLLLHRGQPWRYYLMHSGSSERFEPIGVHAHELGHVLGLPDEYGLGSRAGSGIYCCMAIGNHGANDAWVPVDAPRKEPLAQLQEEAKEKLQELLKLGNRVFPEPRAPRFVDGAEPGEGSELFCMAPPAAAGADGAGGSRPLHLCAPCKIALGWARPACVVPGQGVRVYLDGIEDHPDDVVVVPLDARGRERLVLEYRSKRGFDAGMPRTGLLAWRTGNPLGPLARVAPGANGVLLPAHGVESVDAAHRGPDAVMFPWREKHEIALPRVRVRGIEEADGRVYLEIVGGK